MIRCRLYGRACIRAELSHFASKARRFQRAVDGRGDVVQVERLVREMIGAQLHRFNGGLHAGVGRQQNHEDVLIELLDLPRIVTPSLSGSR